MMTPWIMDDNSRDRLTLARRFRVPANSTHRQYEALRAFFVDGLSSAQAALASATHRAVFESLSISSAPSPRRDFFLPTARQGRPPGKQNASGNRSSLCGNRTSPSTTSAMPWPAKASRSARRPSPLILKEEGFAKLPRRRDEERPDHPRPVTADVADVRQLDLTPRSPSHQVRRSVPVPARPGLGRPGRESWHTAASPDRRWFPAGAPCGRSWP